MGNILKLNDLVIIKREDFEKLVEQLRVLNKDTIPRSESINGVSSITTAWKTIRKLLEIR